MLDGSSNMLGLDTIYKSSSNLAGKVRIFGIIFKVSSAERRTLDVYRRSQYNGHIVCLRFFSNGFTHFLHQFSVKRAGA